MNNKIENRSNKIKLLTASGPTIFKMANLWTEYKKCQLKDLKKADRNSRNLSVELFKLKIVQTLIFKKFTSKKTEFKIDGIHENNAFS